MIRTEYSVKHVRTLSDYCEKCPYFSPESIVMGINDEDVNREVHEACRHGNLCDRLYTRLEKLNE